MCFYPDPVIPLQLTLTSQTSPRDYCLLTLLNISSQTWTAFVQFPSEPCLSHLYTKGIHGIKGSCSNLCFSFVYLCVWCIECKYARGHCIPVNRPRLLDNKNNEKKGEDLFTVQNTEASFFFVSFFFFFPSLSFFSSFHSPFSSSSLVSHLK